MYLRKLSLIVGSVVLLVIGSAAFGQFAGADTKDQSSCQQSQSAAACGKCGDGQCVKQCGENATTCPADCGGVPSSAAACGKCGDGQCVKQCGENATTCPADCGGVPSSAAACGKCGDGKCVKQCGENATTCPADCGGVPSLVTGSGTSSPVTN